MTRPRKNPGASGIRIRDLPLSRRTERERWPSGKASVTKSADIGSIPAFPLVSVSVSAQGGIVALGRAHTRSFPSLSSLLQGWPRNSANICLVEHRSFSTLDSGVSVASFLHSSFLQAINAVMLWRAVIPVT